MYDGTGGKYLYLKNYPVTALIRLAIGRLNVIQVYNTAEYSTASVSITSTGIVVEKNGTSDSTVLFATYDTMTKVVAAIIALSSGWYAALSNSDYGSYASTELIVMFGKNCIDSNSVYCEMPNKAEDNFELDTNKGIVYNPFGFASGHNNVMVSYTAGYSATTMPEDLKLAVKILVKYIYQRRSEETFGLANYRIEDMGAQFERDLPKEALDIIWKYKRMKV